jgi:hypothetical protein
VIKLENPVSAPVAFALLTVQCADNESSIRLNTEEARKLVGDSWQPDPSRLRQVLLYNGVDGEQVRLEGLVSEVQAVSIAGAYKVVAEVLPSNRLRAAFAAGRVSREDAVLELVKVVEVWGTPTKCLYGPQKDVSRPAKTLDAKGNVVAA